MSSPQVPYSNFWGRCQVPTPRFQGADHQRAGPGSAQRAPWQLPRLRPSPRHWSIYEYQSDWTWQVEWYKRLYKILPAHKKKHVNITSESPGHLELLISSYDAFTLSACGRCQSAFSLLTEFRVRGRLCRGACGLTGRNSTIRRLMMCK